MKTNIIIDGVSLNGNTGLTEITTKKTINKVILNEDARMCQIRTEEVSTNYRDLSILFFCLTILVIIISIVVFKKTNEKRNTTTNH